MKCMTTRMCKDCLPVDAHVHELYRQFVEIGHRQLVEQHFGCGDDSKDDNNDDDNGVRG